jgi:hypothetical protein
MSILLKAAAVGIAASALFGLGAGLAVAAEPATGPADGTSNVAAPMDYSRGFDFFNTSSVAMKLTNHSWPGTPPLGTVVQPGGSMHVEVPFDIWGGPGQQSSLDFQPVSGSTASGTLHFDLIIVNAQSTTSSWSGNGLTGLTGFTSDRNLYAMDPAGTTINLDGSHAQGQAQALNLLCGNPLAQCTFTATNEDPKSWGPVHQIGKSQYNGNSTPTVLKKIATDAVGITDSVDVSVKAGGSIFGLINTEVQATYHHIVTDTESFTDEVDANVAVGDTVYVLDRAPVTRDTGNFTITMRNTTYNLTDVYFDSPDPSREGQWLVCSKMENKCPIGPDESPAVPMH